MEAKEKQGQATQLKFDPGFELTASELAGVNTTSGGSRPVFDKLTRATIVSAQVFKRGERQKDSRDCEYTPAYLSVEFRVEGVKEPVRDAYGFRLYGGKNEEPVRAFLGGNSYAGKLRQLAVETFGLAKNVSLSDFVAVLKSKEVAIKSETGSYLGREFNKVVVQQFRI